MYRSRILLHQLTKKSNELRPHKRCEQTSPSTYRPGEKSNRNAQPEPLAGYLDHVKHQLRFGTEIVLVADARRILG